MTIVPTTTDHTVWLSTLLKHAAVDALDHPVGTLADAIVRLRTNSYPILTGLVVRINSQRVFAPIAQVVAIDGQRIELTATRLDLRPFERRHGEVLLRDDVLGHRLIDIQRVALVRAYDVQLRQTEDEWVVSGLDVHKHQWLHLGARHDRHAPHDWNRFEALIGHEASATARSPQNRLTRLKAAQIADIIEDASDVEQDELLAHVHSDPELEADVFEELDDGRQAQLLKNRTSDEAAKVLDRMRADDAADAIMDMPHDRRHEVLDCLSVAQRTKVLTLLRYGAGTAGGLMGMDFIAVPESNTVQDALALIRSSVTLQPEALTAIYTIDEQGRLAGAIGLVRALQLDPEAILRDTVGPDPIHATAGEDLTEITTRMADFNLLTLPVVDDNHRLLGVVTVDDALEYAIPRDWRRREA